ncbi:MAG: hypothetical protein ACT4P3_14195 [Betaproteobacteria bacterium]
MKYRIEPLAGYLKAEMWERDTAEETREFVDAILAALRETGLARLLISIRASRPVFKVEQWGLSAALDRIAGTPGLKVAFISDSRETAMSQDYIALIARQRGLAFRAFAAESEAVAWLLEEAL